jgi:protein-tyrosine phosphatase
LENPEAAQLGLTHEGEAASSKGVRYLSFPIPDRDVPRSMPDTLNLVRQIVTELESGRNVAIHCRQSIGRSGLIAASVLAASGMDLESAIQAVSDARGLTIPETPEQLRWLRHLPVNNMVSTS